MSIKVGRNDSCSCGSGKKYKHCCGLNVAEYRSEERHGGLVLDFLEQHDDAWIQAEKTQDLQFLANHAKAIRQVLKATGESSRPFIFVDRRTGVVRGFTGADIMVALASLGTQAPVAEAIRNRVETLEEEEYLMCVISASGHTGLYRMTTSKRSIEYLQLWAATPGRGH